MGSVKAVAAALITVNIPNALTVAAIQLSDVRDLVTIILGLVSLVTTVLIARHTLRARAIHVISDEAARECGQLPKPPDNCPHK